MLSPPLRAHALIAVVVCLWLIPAAGQEVPAKPYKWLLLPNVGFDTDDGLGFGGSADLQRVDGEHDPYRWGLHLQGFATLRGFHQYELEADFLGLGRRGNLRFTANLSYRQWKNDGYWGLGNGTTREAAFVGDFDTDDPRRKRYLYSLIQPYAYLVLRVGSEGPLATFAALTIQWTRVAAYDGSLLQEQRPVGMDGGFSTQAAAGVILDTRWPENAPERGIFAELSVRLAPGFSGLAYAFGGPFASVRGYHSLAPGRLVVAWRVMAEWLLGDVPFYELVRWGGSVPILGVGGHETVRGVPFGRWRAPGRAVANLEWRLDVVRFPLLKAPMRIQVVPFADVCAVWGAGESATADAPALPFHPGVGMGLHFVWSEAFVARIDAAVAPDAVRRDDGSVAQPPGWGFYMMFDQTF